MKKEYGTGGSSHALAGSDHSWEGHDFKGIELKKGNISEPYAQVLLSWKVVEKRIRKLVAEDKYLSPAGKEAYAKYKEEEAQKALEKAQAAIERKTKAACKEAIERTIAEKFDGYRLPKETAEEVIKRFGSERVSYVLANTVTHLSHDGRFSPDNKEWAKSIEPYAMWENRDLIVGSHPAVLNGFINQTRRYMEQEKELAAQKEKQTEGAAEDEPRFSVGETSDAFEPGQDFAIWDNAREDYYTDADGTIPTFGTKEEAEDYLQGMGQEQGISGHDVQKAEEEPLEPALEPAIETPVKQSVPKIDKSNAVNFHITDDTLGAGNAKEKFKRNVEAIRTLEKIESENRIATPEEQQILSQYVGWGGLSDAFDESKSAWAGEYRELKELLSPQEYASARESTLNAHYTSPAIIRSIYDTLDRMGFEKGNVLEPAMGIGNFFGMLPEKMQESRLYGVELDGITGRIAKQLYPKADIKISGLEKR